MQTIYPILRYNDDQGVDSMAMFRIWLCSGFFERAQAAGANIQYPPTNTDFGSREYHVLDLEGHPWTFGTYRPSAEDCENE